MFQNNYSDNNISVAETTRRSWDEEDQRLSRQHDLAVRQLELAYMRQDQNWGSLIKIPLTIILIPVYIVLAFALCLAMIRKYKPPQELLNLFKF